MSKPMKRHRKPEAKKMDYGSAVGPVWENLQEVRTALRNYDWETEQERKELVQEYNICKARLEAEGYDIEPL